LLVIPFYDWHACVTFIFLIGQQIAVMVWYGLVWCGQSKKGEIMTKKVMKLIDPYTGLLECKVCGQQALGMIKPQSGGHFYRGAWQCPNGCKLD
jgi:hypothetical protein